MFINSLGGPTEHKWHLSGGIKPAEKPGLHNRTQIAWRIISHQTAAGIGLLKTHLRRAGVPREFIEELSGDVRKKAIDIYVHIDKKELRKSYLAHILNLGV